MNAELQRIARRDKKAFLSDQSKEIEENNRMGKTRDLFKKIRNTKGTFHEKMGSIKDRNSMDLTEAEDIKKRWQEYTEELHKKDLHNPDNHEGVITHTYLEPDIQECEVKWALGSITTNKASEDDGLPTEMVPRSPFGILLLSFPFLERLSNLSFCLSTSPSSGSFPNRTKQRGTAIRAGP